MVYLIRYLGKVCPTMDLELHMDLVTTRELPKCVNVPSNSWGQMTDQSHGFLT